MPKYTEAEVTSWLTDLSDGTLDLNDDNCGLAQAALDYLRQPPQPPVALEGDTV